VLPGCGRQLRPVRVQGRTEREQRQTESGSSRVGIIEIVLSKAYRTERAEWGEESRPRSVDCGRKRRDAWICPFPARQQHANVLLAANNHVLQRAIWSEELVLGSCANPQCLARGRGQARESRQTLQGTLVKCHSLAPPHSQLATRGMQALSVPGYTAISRTNKTGRYPAYAIKR